jgi:hypothetical protein
MQLVLEAMKSMPIEQLLRESGSKHIAAAHEAGHAIVNTAFGRPVRKIYIERVVLPLNGESAWGGWCITKHRPPDVARGDVNRPGNPGDSVL